MTYENKTIFREYFGNHPLIKVLEFFIENDLYDYNTMDIFRETGVARTTLQYIIEDLLKKEIIIKTRAVGKSQMYKLNRGNSVVEELVNFAINLIINVNKARIEAEQINN